jgi:hypothetical protein
MHKLSDPWSVFRSESFCILLLFVQDRFRWRIVMNQTLSPLPLRKCVTIPCKVRSRRWRFNRSGNHQMRVFLRFHIHTFTVWSCRSELVPPLRNEQLFILMLRSWNSFLIGISFYVFYFRYLIGIWSRISSWNIRYKTKVTNKLYLFKSTPA